MHHSGAQSAPRQQRPQSQPALPADAALLCDKQQNRSDCVKETGSEAQKGGKKRWIGTSRRCEDLRKGLRGGRVAQVCRSPYVFFAWLISTPVVGQWHCVVVFFVSQAKSSPVRSKSRCLGTCVIGSILRSRSVMLDCRLIANIFSTVVASTHG